MLTGVNEKCYMFSLFNQKNNTENLYEIVENIYSNFDYPVEISGLIGYMPTDRTYKTKEEYTEEIMRKWESYLSTEKEILNKESSRLK
jgi:hypothetical protein